MKRNTFDTTAWWTTSRGIKTETESVKLHHNGQVAYLDRPVENSWEKQRRKKKKNSLAVSALFQGNACFYHHHDNGEEVQNQQG